ncbi:DEAD/DEAH box helicase [Humibacter ginsenosidimutans]|uniref:DEAD/DEAH box helicase n=1 Tax=Humibacter ginsenosidimutans TaxID=2599293 RepID=A0A5B8M011_9MICO|nr:DEAD/DEAH box helicase [Humibacter ginsenosidimutans]QDZ13713.1 DEAD/DEAH box helicase [Humibacter ginsenosidimutans]
MTDQLSPAERFAASRSRVGHPRLEDFRREQSFDLDPFQREACASLEDGRSVLVAAPTGAGKTVVAAFAVALAMRHPTAKVFYTTPMKALSNQKYQEFVDDYGTDAVGLLTGDTNVNAGARVVVMTTEVLRNMLYADSDLLADLAYVVMDEVHYLADRFRGAVWEEVIIHLPAEVRLVSLSATVSNAEEFGDWLQAVRGDTDVVVSESRPVPLEQHVLVRQRLVDLFESASRGAANKVNPELVQMARVGGRPSGSRQFGDRGRRHGRGGRPDSGRLDRPEVIRLLDDRNLLPAIAFVFSRAGCDQAVSQVLRSGIRLTEAHEREEIRRVAEERCRTIADEDLAVLGYWEWLEGLQRGVAAHHAGLIPAFKEVVEELFQRKLVKVVFATETLALGINMPARTVVLERLEKFNGEARVPITPGEYTQLTGRAGRRGIDVEGHCVIQWRDGLDPQAVAALASRRSYPLNSSFRPTYNMAVNLVAQFGRERTREILESSFAQFQADRAVVDLARTVRKQEESLAGYERAMQCHLGDFAEYAALRRELSDLERKGAKASSQSAAARERRAHELADVRRRMKQHPCHGCAEREQHARWAERWWRLKRETDALTRQIHTRTGAVATVFDRVGDVLLELGYLADRGGEIVPTQHAHVLGRIYGERDLLVAECLRRGAWRELDVPGLAAMACAIVYEPRRDEQNPSERYLPRGAFRGALQKTEELWARLDDVERSHRLPGSEPLATGLCVAMFEWASGRSLASVLTEADLPAGDFVRWSKQVIDLLDQLSGVATGTLAIVARDALVAVRRGIVAYSGVA